VLVALKQSKALYIIDMENYFNPLYVFTHFKQKDREPLCSNGVTNELILMECVLTETSCFQSVIFVSVQFTVVVAVIL